MSSAAFAYAAADFGEEPYVSSPRFTAVTPQREDREYIESDFCSREGAAALKAKIEAYWRERGQNVMISMHNVGFHPAIRAARYDVRSDMVNGLPRNAAKPKPANED